MVCSYPKINFKICSLVHTHSRKSIITHDWDSRDTQEYSFTIELAITRLVFYTEVSDVFDPKMLLFLEIHTLQILCRLELAVSARSPLPL